MEYDAFSSCGDIERQPCTVCGRKFNPESLGKHEVVCRNSQLKSRQRKVFDSGKQRLQGTDAALLTKAKTTSSSRQVEVQLTVKDTHWRENHLDFVNSIRSARAAQRAINTGGPLPPPPPPSKNPNYIGCPHCTRRFNPKAAERHIPFCAQRTKTYGAPVKPLHRRAATDAGYGVTSGYNSHAVHGKSIANSQDAAADIHSASSYRGGQNSANLSRQEFRTLHRISATRLPVHNPAPSINAHQNASGRKQSALSSTGRNRVARPKSSVRFSDEVDVETVPRNVKAIRSNPRPPPNPPPPHPPPSHPPSSHHPRSHHPPSHAPPSHAPPFHAPPFHASPSHPPPSHPFNNASTNSHHGNQGGYRTSTASEIRQTQIGSPGSISQGLGEGITGRPPNSTFTWRDTASSSFETTYKLHSPRSRAARSFTNLQNGEHNPTSSPPAYPPTDPTLRGLSPLSISPKSQTKSPPGQRSIIDLSTSPQSVLSSSSERATSTNSPHSVGILSPKHDASLVAYTDGSNVLAPFCHGCGTKYPVPDARFCCGCGTRRAYLSPDSLR